MNREQWARVTALFHEASAYPPAERARWLANHCSDPAIQSEVEAMLRAYETNPEFMEQPVAELPRDVESLLDVREVAVGQRIGPFDLVSELGRGGMGEVFAAVRADGHYDQKVALKLVRAGYATAGVVERFRAERQILAGLEHPNIARLLDGGTTEAGTPYLVMELVDGVPIDVFCRARNLSVSERLQLFLHVCAAVQLRASAAGHSPRHQASQHPRHDEWDSEAVGLRDRQGAGFGRQHGRDDAAAVHARIRQSRASAWRAGVDCYGRLRAWHGALPSAHGPFSVPHREPERMASCPLRLRARNLNDRAPR